MDDPQYVHDDVSSDYLCQWILYYTYHSHMDSPHYVKVDMQNAYDVSSGHTC